jgi:hypothetical protein
MGRCAGKGAGRKQSPRCASDSLNYIANNSARQSPLLKTICEYNERLYGLRLEAASSMGTYSALPGTACAPFQMVGVVVPDSEQTGSVCQKVLP